MELEFRPRPVPSVIAALAVIALLILGTWQVTRYLEKAEAEDRRASLARAEPVDVDSLEAFDDPANNYRRVKVAGQLDQDRTAVFLYRNRDRRAGCWLASPLRLSGGGEVLVTRGWIPATEGVACDPSGLGTPASDVWTGVIHVPQRVLHDAQTRAANDPARPWGTFDVDGAYEVLGMSPRPERPAVLVLAEEHSGDPFPIAATDLTEAPYLTSATHLSYAFTWYGLIVFVVGIWVFFSARRVDGERG
jgi:surfeit locus 1 family protein